jgi:hypothetical protein
VCSLPIKIVDDDKSIVGSEQLSIRGRGIPVANAELQQEVRQL